MKTKDGKGVNRIAVAPYFLIMILYFDTETTGLKPGKICQLSYILQSGESVTPKNFFFKVGYIEPSATAIHGFTPEILESLSGGKIFEDFAEEIKSDFSSADLIVAHNFEFDRMFMSAEFSAVPDNFTYKQSFCSMKKFTPICKLLRSDNVRFKYPKLSELCEFFDIYPYDISKTMANLYGVAKGAHDARYDTVALYLAVNKGAKYFEELQNAIKCGYGE